MISTYDNLISKASQLWNVPFAWIKAIISAESDFNPNAYRAEPHINDASYGLMQVLLKTARSLGYEGEPTGLYDPETNIMLGTKYLSQLRDQWGDNFERIYSAYNSGGGLNYLTNPTVRAHVDRAVERLKEVLGWGISVLTSKDAIIIGAIALLVSAALSKRRKT